MALYYFDLVNEQGLSADEEGVECADIAAVQNEAARALADMARDAIHANTEVPTHQLAIQVRDRNGPVLRASFQFEIHRTTGRREG